MDHPYIQRSAPLRDGFVRMVSVPSDVERIRATLTADGVAGVEDFGRFVNDTTYLSPSSFDERAAMPTLLALLPTLTERRAVEAVARYLGRPWAKPSAFPVLLESFREWAPRDWVVGWAIGDSLARIASPHDLDGLLEVAGDASYGKARQMVVHSLWRYRKDDRVEGVLVELADDPDICLHAMSALRRTIGNQAALPLLRRLGDTSVDETVRQQAARQMRKAQRAARAT